jgi:hypothetical protein
LGYVVPGICLALVAAFALFDLRNERPAITADSDLPVPGGATS